MKVIYDPSLDISYPYPRADEEEILGLDPSLHVLEVVTLAQPDYDPSTQQLEPTDVADLDAGTMTRGWNVAARYQGPPDRPNYEKLYGDILVSGVYQTAVIPQAMGSTAVNFAATVLGLALSDAAAGRPNDAAITAALGLVLATATLTPEDLAEIDALLAASNLTRLKP